MEEEKMDEFFRSFGQDVAVRLCMPVVDMPELTEDALAISMPCALCLQACWYDTTMVLPLPDDIRELVICNHCAMGHPQLRTALASVTWGTRQSWN